MPRAGFKRGRPCPRSFDLPNPRRRAVRGSPSPIARPAGIALELAGFATPARREKRGYPSYIARPAEVALDLARVVSPARGRVCGFAKNISPPAKGGRAAPARPPT